MKKRIVAVMLSAIMAVVPMAVSASAAETETETETETAAAETEGASEAESETEKKVDLTGLTIGVQLGTTGDLSVTDEYGDDAVERYNKGFEAVQALVQGKIDAVVIDELHGQNDQALVGGIPKRLGALIEELAQLARIGIRRAEVKAVAFVQHNARLGGVAHDKA